MKHTTRLTKTGLWVVVLVTLIAGVGGFARSAASQELVKSQGIRFRLIPAGTYILGSPPEEPGRYVDEAPTHSVRLPAFYIAITETTNAQYARFLKATGYEAPLYWQDRNLNAPNQPVVGVTWNDAAAFTKWLTRVTGVQHRLPTEAEWEAAARGGLNLQPYPWGDAAPEADGIYRANFYPGSPGYRFTAPVGSFRPNGYGLFDMAGNVAEWCLDTFSPGRGAFRSVDNRILKGGSYYSRARDLRCAAHQSAPPQSTDGFIGFRVVRLPAP